MECPGDRQPVLQIDKFFRGLGKNKFGSLGFGLQKVAKTGADRTYPKYLFKG